MSSSTAVHLIFCEQVSLTLEATHQLDLGSKLPGSSRAGIIGVHTHD